MAAITREHLRYARQPVQRLIVDYPYQGIGAAARALQLSTLSCKNPAVMTRSAATAFVQTTWLASSNEICSDSRPLGRRAALVARSLAREAKAPPASVPELRTSLIQ